MKNISHITLNTGHIAVYEDDSIMENDTRSEIQRMVKDAKEVGRTEVLDGVIASVAEDEELGVYMATLYIGGNKEIPIVETTGAFTEEGAKWLWENMNEVYHIAYEDRAKATECPKVPFICDLVYPTSILVPYTLDWTGSFAKFFGLEMLKSFENEQ